MEDIKWLPGALVIIGGLITIFFMFMQYFEAKQVPEGSSEIIVALSNTASSLILFPIMLCIIVIGLGALMISKPMTGTAVTAGFIGMYLLILNWVGFIFIFGGSVLALFIWRELGKRLL